MTGIRAGLWAVVIGLVSLESAAVASASDVNSAADLVLIHGDVYSAGGWAQAMAVTKGVITAVGDDALIETYTGPKTNVIDLHGKTVVPGLHDMHVHPTGAGQLHQQCVFPQGSSPDQVLEVIGGCVSKHAKGDWIVGGQWDAASFGDTPPNRALLDKVAPDNPVSLMDISAHSLWLNSKALATVGITRNTPNPPGGVIEHDADGEPTGIVRESVREIVMRAIPAATPAQNAAALKWALHQMLAYGITSLTDAAVDEPIMQAYATLADEGALKQRVRGCVLWHPTLFSAPSGGMSDPILRRNLYARARFTPDCVKIILDGVPTDGHTAAMVEPYADASRLDEARARGLLMVPQKLLDAAVTDFDKRGLTVKFHAAGDAAVRAGLDAIEAARKANGFTGLLHDVGHNSFVQKEDIARARALHATFEMSPYIWYPNPIIPDIEKAIGPERMKRWIPVKDAIDSGALVVPGSDWAVVPSVNPWIAIETLVTRQMPGGGGRPLGEGQRITLKQAMDLFTVNAARQMGQANILGSIRPGFLADVIVLDRNPFRIPITDVHRTTVRTVIIGGQVVLDAASK